MLWPTEVQLTFEDNLQLVPQNVEDAVTGARLRDDMSLQPAPAGVLVEIITRLHRFIHVLQEPSSCGKTGKDQQFKNKTNTCNSCMCARDEGGDFAKNNKDDKAKSRLSHLQWHSLQSCTRCWGWSEAAVLKQSVSTIRKEQSGLDFRPQLRRRGNSKKTKSAVPVRERGSVSLSQQRFRSFTSGGN